MQAHVLRALVFSSAVAPAAAPSGNPQAARCEMELKFTLASGSSGDVDACPRMKRDGHDTLTGVVEGSETLVGDHIEYRGTLSRAAVSRTGRVRIDSRNQPVLKRLVEKNTWQDTKPRPKEAPEGWALPVRRKLQARQPH